MHYHQKNKKYSVDQNYKDLDGNTKSFTVINHDPKATMATYNPTEEEKQQVKDELSRFRKELQDYVLSQHASLCPPPMQTTFIFRGEFTDSFRWNEAAVRDEGLSLDALRNLAVLVEKRKELYT